MTPGCMGKPRRGGEGMDDAWNVWEKAWSTWNKASDKGNPECNGKAVAIIKEYGRTIAAEARKEGIDEMEKAVFEPFKVVEYISRMALWDCLKSTVKRLKEKA